MREVWRAGRGTRCGGEAALGSRPVRQTRELGHLRLHERLGEYAHADAEEVGIPSAIALRTVSRTGVPSAATLPAVSAPVVTVVARRFHRVITPRGSSIV